MTESNNVPGYTFLSGTNVLNCEFSGATGTAIVKESDPSDNKNGAVVNAECTFTNTAIAPTLTLVKAVSGSDADPSEWTLAADGTTGSFSGAGNSDDVTDQEVTAGVTYTLSESGGPSGYDDWTGSGPVTWTATCRRNEISLGYGESAECTITNTAIAPTLTWSRRSGQRRGSVGADAGGGRDDGQLQRRGELR